MQPLPVNAFGSMLAVGIVAILSPQSIRVTDATSSTQTLECSERSYSRQNLSGLQMLGGDVLVSKNATTLQCLALCCASVSGARCTAWNLHLSSTDPTHHPGECWLSTNTTSIAAQPATAVDVWVGGSAVPATCFGRECRAPPPSCDGSNYTQCRYQLWQTVFNTTTGVLPTRSTPDYVEDWTNWTMEGVPGPGRGTGIGNVAWRVGLQKLVWTIGGAGGGMREGMLRLNSTVWYSRNTTGNAASNSPPVGVGVPSTDDVHCPTPDRPGYESWRQQSDTLVIHHNGHAVCSGSDRTEECTDCTPNYDTTQDWLNQLGYDVFEMHMPLHGCNRIPANTSCTNHCVGSPSRGFDCSSCRPIGTSGSLVGDHGWFEQFEQQGDEVMRYFLEPVVLAVNYAVNVLGYKHVVMAGLSGGGWTTTLAAAIDPRIELSMPIAGSVPKFPSVLYPRWVPELPEGAGKGIGGGGDFEQSDARPMYAACGWACLYVLSSLEQGRHSLQMLHEHDSCCFAAFGLHADIKAYNRFVQNELARQTHGGGWFQTAANLGNYHENNYRDKVVIALMIERLRREGGILSQHFDDIPFDVLRLGPYAHR